MELRLLQSCSVSSIPRTGLIVKPFVHCGVNKLPTPSRYPNARNLKLVSVRAQASGSAKSPVEAIPKNVDPKDEDLIFVAGATGKVGSRTVRELLKLGFKVRAGVRSVQRAKSLVESVKQMKIDEASVEGTQPIEKLDIVQCDLEKPDQIGPALGNASVVICCIGASEKEVFDVTGPYRIDFQATKNLIDAATVTKVDHFILLTSLGTNKVGFPAAILNLFWGVLIWKRKAEEALLASGIPYTIVRPGGMERPTDSYKETHNITLSPEDTLFGGQVSNLQVAELLAFMAKNRGLSHCKVVEVIAETTAPLTPMEELLAKIPSQRAGGASLKEPGVADRREPAISKSVSYETPQATVTSIPKEPTQGKATVTSPLSPYIMYEDLKPPTSPTPTTPSNSSSATKAEPVGAISATTNSAPPSIQINSEPSSIVIEKEEAIQTQVKKPTPLSPYTCYDDLKPPVSPTPKAPSGRKEDANVTEVALKPSATDSEASQVSTEVAVTDAEPKSAAVRVFLSPYAAYEDLKPPTSPTPSPRKL